VEEIIKKLVLKLNASSGAIMVVDEREKVLKCGASYNMPDVWVQLVNPLENTPDKNTNGRVAVTGKAEIINNMNIDFHGHPIYSVIVVPIKKSEIVIGNIEIITDDHTKNFDAFDQAILEQAAKQDLASLIP
jgi:GAF domain